MQIRIQETWEPLDCKLDNYEVFFVSEEDVVLKDDQYVLNYAIANLHTRRVEGYAPSLAAAVDTCMMLEATTEEWNKRKAAEAIAEESVLELFENITKDSDDDTPVH